MNRRAYAYFTGSRYRHQALLFMRVFISVMMFTSAIGKSQQYYLLEPNYPTLWGIEAGSVMSAITVVEVTCSCLIVMGLLTKPAAWLMAAGMFVSLFVMFPSKSFAQSELQFVYMCIYVYIGLAGGGRYALDGLLLVPRKKQNATPKAPQNRSKK